MKKNTVRVYAILGIIFVVFSVISFAVPFVKSPTFVMAYLFGAIAIVFQIYTFRISFEKENTVKSKFYGFPIAQISVIYLVIQLLLSFVEMALALFIPWWVGLILNIVIVAAASIGTISVDAMRDEIERQDVKIVKEVENMRKLQSLSNSLMSVCEEKEIKEQIKKLAEEFRYSDPVSSEATKPYEKELEQLVGELQEALLENDIASAKVLCSKVSIALKERNRICAVNK